MASAQRRWRPATSDLPVRLYPVDGATIQVNANWKGDPNDPRYAQITGKLGKEALTAAAR